ncbi:MAG: DegT/DnrJ/EryC1/StrS family aminotransferase [Sphingomonas sp.]|nr:DegT/DnrJ/EryC1/StrS family aminotransferase [Sphingomonas sp.]
MAEDPILVTRPYLPPLAELLPYLEEIWASRWLTNHGPFHQRFAEALREFLGAAQVSLTANGMLALELAIEASALKGEVITTPYSFVATTHAVRRSGLKPVFVDIKRGDLNIDPARIEERITPETSAIVAVHCYGNPCEGDELQRIADNHGLKLIFDAAHAFGARQHGKAVAIQGDYSIISFHATKAFNTFEGGAVLSRDSAAKQLIDRFSNFGIADEITVQAVGSNAKMSEFNAALGLLQLSHFENAREGRRRVDARYRSSLQGIRGIEMITIPEGLEPNFSYFPVLITEEYGLSRDALYEKLKANGIFSRRYFYPLLSTLPMYRDLESAAPANLPVATHAADQILCLPIYHDLGESDQDRIIDLVAG